MGRALPTLFNSAYNFTEFVADGVIFAEINVHLTRDLAEMRIFVISVRAPWWACLKQGNMSHETNTSDLPVQLKAERQPSTWCIGQCLCLCYSLFAGEVNVAYYY
ncbi:uncharacterized protein LOC113328161 [Papaver somniferum]|uniref:uncharacterized protein LOC113328161 n=1 Tax=Papaver somniferum TaxID=3469 RepID=UPI000E6FB0F6|nr:uncharacterized protein LOC113328161 [Papaver somniferum]